MLSNRIMSQAGNPSPTGELTWNSIEMASFSGHESFPLRNTWLTKGVVGCAEDPLLFTREEAMVSLGVGKNMVRSIRHWCLATRVLEEDPTIKNNRGHSLRPTIIGNRVFLAGGGWDRYLEDIGTLWLIHWLLVTNLQRATTWYLAFNALHQPEFTRSSIERAVTDLARRLPSVRVSESTLKRDVDVFIRTYVSTASPLDQSTEDSLECPLVELGLVYEQPQSTLFAFTRGPKDSLPDAVFIFSMWDYAQRRPGQRSFTFDELAYGPLGVGRAFKLDEHSLAERLDRLADVTGGAWQFSETAGYKQVVFVRDIDAIQILSDYYSGRSVPVSGAIR